MNKLNRPQPRKSASLVLGALAIAGLIDLLPAQTYTAPTNGTAYIFIAPPQDISNAADHSGAVPLAPFTIIALDSATAESDSTQTITQAFQIGAGGGTIDSGTGDLTTTLSGNITGSSALTFGNLNTGTFVLSGDNSGFTGTVLVAGTATVQAGSATAISPSVFTVNGVLDLAGNSSTVTGLMGTGSVESSAGAATLTVNDASANLFSGMLTDGGGTLALTKTGAGTLTLTGGNSFSGGTTITTGTLQVGNSSALGTGNVVNNAALTTNSVATGLTVNVGGNYTQGAPGSLTLNLYGLTNFDKVALTSGGGVANLNGTLDLNIHQQIYPGSGDVFHVLTTNNPITSSFSSVVTNDPGIAYNVYYTHDVVIQFPFAAGYLTPNQLAVARYLDEHDITINSAAFGNLITALNNLSGPAGLGKYFDQLTTVNFAQFTSSTAFNNTSFLTQQMDDYLANHRGPDGVFIASAGGIDYSALTVSDPDYLPGLQQIHSRLLAWSPAPGTGLLSDTSESVLGGVDMKDMKQASTASGQSEGNRWNAFVSGNAILAQDFSDATSGTSHQDLTTEAVQVGIDYAITPNFLVGAMFGYGHTDADLDNLGSTATVDTYSPALYASFAKDGWYANALGSYGFSNYTQSRNVAIGSFGGTANSAPSGDQIVGNLDGGYDFHHGALTYGPLAGVQYVHLDVNGYGESGLPGADLTIGDNQADSLRSRLGGRISYAFQGCGMTFIPHFSASWQHEFLDQSRGITSQFSDIGAGSFDVKTENPSRDSALADLGVDAVLNKTVTLFVDYAAQAGQDNYFGQSVQAGLKIGF